MAEIDQIVHLLEEQTIARSIGLPHDEARMHYPLQSNTVRTWDEFRQLMTDYYSHHRASVANGARPSPHEAFSRASEIVESQYRRRGGDVAMAFNDCLDGTNNGCRGILDAICDGLKEQEISQYVRHVFSRYVAPNDYEGRTEIIRQLFDRLGPYFSSLVHRDTPERYANRLEELVRAFVDAAAQTARQARRM